MTQQSVNSNDGMALQKGDVVGALKELQGLTFSLVTGGSANTKFDLAAIRQEDTIVAAWNNNAGTVTDLAGTMSIVDCHASGTVTAASVLAADTVTVDGRVYTAIANGATPAFGQFSIGADDNECAANLAAAINLGEQADTTSKVTATASSAVVTIKARAEGTGGNSIALATSNNTRLAKSGTALANGTATGGIKSTSATNQIVLVWLNKHA